MSHVIQVDLLIKDEFLPCLERACRTRGLELVRDQKTYKWFGEWVGDYALPTGFSKRDLGKCEHAIRVPGEGRAYEIGLVRNRQPDATGQIPAGYRLLYDFWAGGHGLEEKAGPACGPLLQAYTAEVTRQQARRQGHRILSETVNAQGQLVIKVQT